MAKTFEEVETDAHIAMGVSLSKIEMMTLLNIDFLSSPPSK